MDEERQKKQQQLNFNLNPIKTPIYHVDSYLMTSNDHGMVFNFAQALPDPKQQQVVARVALTKSQAKEFLKNLNDHIEKFEV